MKGFYVDDESFTSGQNDFLEIYPLDVPEFDSVTKKLSVPVSEPLIIKDETDGDFSVATYLDVIPGIKAVNTYKNFLSYFPQYFHSIFIIQLDFEESPSLSVFI